MTQSNVLLILADDQRYDFMRYMPNVRNLIAAQGREFTACRCNVSLCQPSRVGILTGQYSRRHHCMGNAPEELASFDDTNTLAAWLQAVGYRTGLVGKYLNGRDFTTPPPPGWNTWRELSEATGYTSLGYEVREGTTVTTPNQPQIEYLRDQALQFIGGGSQPWFLLLTPSSPHFPFQPEPDDLFAWSHVKWPVVNEEDVSDKPSWIRNQPPLQEAQLVEFRDVARGQLREGTALDRMIGSLINAIPAATLADTTIIYSSDNGLLYGEHRIPFSSVLKSVPYDAGMRVPLVMRGPDVAVGTSAEPVTMGSDITATIVGIAEATPGLTQDGVDLRDVIANGAAYASRTLLHQLDERINFGQAPACDGITTATRKLIRYPSQSGSDRYEAYDLDTDPDELLNWANDTLRTNERDTLEQALDALLTAP